MKFKFLVKNKVGSLPENPGVYVFKNGRKILYIGKAANIRGRVKNHFGQPAYRDNLFINQVSKIGYLKTESEITALILEANLIKKHQPKFNVVWRDDKNYFFVGITREDFPRIFITHQTKLKIVNLAPTPSFGVGVNKLKIHYVGPFVDGNALKQTLKVLRKVFPYRSCKTLLKRPCLWYQLGRCPAPCLLKSKIDQQIPEFQSKINKECRQNAKNLIKVLQGKKVEVLKRLKKEMKEFSVLRNFERAAKIRDQITALEKIIAHAKIFSIRENGYLIKMPWHNYQVVDEVAASSPPFANARVVNEAAAVSPPFANARVVNEVAASSPPFANARVVNEVAAISPPFARLRLARVVDELRSSPPFAGTRVWKEVEEKLKNFLGVKRGISRIEAYDISNIQGKLATGSMVIFINGRAAKNFYRKFKIKYVNSARSAKAPPNAAATMRIGKPNDVAMIKEVLGRRFKHSEWPYPDLILIDGGKAQLNAAAQCLKWRFKHLGMMALTKKNELYIEGKKRPILLKTLPREISNLILQLRDEAHRFALIYHKKLREIDLREGL